MSNLYQKVCLIYKLFYFLVFNFCENYNITLDLSKNPSSSYYSPATSKKIENQNNNNSNTISIKNEPNTKYKNAFEILNNMNNNKYTLKYIEENKLKNKNSENDNNMNYCPININSNANRYNKSNKSYNRSSSYLNKFNNNNNIKGDKNKNRSTKKCNTAKSNGKDKEKIKDNIQEYKINNLSSSFNNNFTNIKTNKIVFIDLKDNENNFLKNDLNNDDYQNDNKFNDRYARNTNPNEDNNNNLILRSSESGFNKNNKMNKSTTLSNANHNKLFLANNTKKNNFNNFEDRNISKKEKCFLNLKVQNLDQNKQGNSSMSNNFSIFEDKNGKEFVISKNNLIKLEDLKSKGLSKKECSYYILSKSPVLRLCERMYFSRSSSALRNLLPKESTMKEHKIILKNKIDELEKKINLCDKILETPFTATKTADITLNFITSLMEMEFREYPILLANEEEKKYYINFIKILYHLFNIEIVVNDGGNNILDKNSNILSLRQNLYTKINHKGFKSIRDILYNQFIDKKDTIKDIPKIAEINYLVSKVNNMLEIHNSLKMCKFISFTLYLIKEIIQFGNNIKSSVELKSKAKNLIDIINRKINKLNSKYNNK